MRYIKSPSTDAFFNMALEEYLFETLSQQQDSFMLWQNKNAVVVGRYQNALAEVNRSWIEQNNVQLVRRLSGGGAMYQDLGNLNFTFVVAQTSAKDINFDMFITPVLAALNAMGVAAGQSGRNDIEINGKKISGNAQYNRKGRTMHHGTLLYNSQLQSVGLALNPSAEKIASKAVASVRSRVTNIIEHMRTPYTLQQFEQELLKEMFAANPLTHYALTPADISAVQALAQQKYATWQWNWGRSPQGEFCKKKRYPFGEVEIWLATSGGRLQSISFSGDFFGNADPNVLNEKLQGTSLQKQSLQAALTGEEVTTYIHGMSNDMLIDFILG